MKLSEIVQFEETIVSINLEGLGLQTLKGKFDYSDKITKEFNISRNHLENLIGCPVECDRLDANNNHLSSLEGIPRIINGFCLLKTNHLTNLKGIHKMMDEIDRGFDMTGNPMTSNVLGVLMIKGDQRFINLSNQNNDWSRVMGILNEHLYGERDVLECQEDLVRAGYKEFAKL